MLKDLLTIKAKLITLSLFPLVLFTGLIFLNPMLTPKLFIIVSIASILLMAVVSLLMISSIINPLLQLQKSIELSSKTSDLTVSAPINSIDSIGYTAKAFNNMLKKFHDIVQEVTLANEQLVLSSGQLSSIALETKDGIVNQRAKISHVSEAAENMINTVEEIANNAANAADAAKGALQAAMAGSEVIEKTLQSTTLLSADVERANEVIKRVDEDTKQIDTVLVVIKGIAEKTNLLALNAAIEAARAGEQGRGFAVVADEVRTLAKRTQQSTQEIQSMIERLQSGVQQAVQVMSEGESRASSNVEKATSAGESLNSIRQAINLISDMSGQIAEATKNHKKVAESVNENISTISNVSVVNSNNANQTADASKSIEGIASKLQQMVGIFTV